VSAAVPYHARWQHLTYDVVKRHLVQRIFKELCISRTINTGTSQFFLPAKFHNFAISGLFFRHKNIRVQFFMKHRVYMLWLKYCFCHLTYVHMWFQRGLFLIKWLCFEKNGQRKTYTVFYAWKTAWMCSVQFCSVCLKLHWQRWSCVSDYPDGFPPCCSLAIAKWTRAQVEWRVFQITRAQHKGKCYDQVKNWV